MSEENSKESIRIKRLREPEEAKRCAELMATSEPWKTLQRTYEDSFMMLTDPVREAYVALINDEVVGFVILRMDGAFVGYIQTAGVMPQWRNRRIGTLLIRFAEQRIFQQFPNVFLCASSFNKKAQELYKRLGYEVIGELKDFIVPGHSEILMRKTVGPLKGFKKPAIDSTYLLGCPLSDIVEPLD